MSKQYWRRIRTDLIEAQTEGGRQRIFITNVDGKFYVQVRCVWSETQSYVQSNVYSGNSDGNHFDIESNAATEVAHRFKLEKW